MISHGYVIHQYISEILYNMWKSKRSIWPQVCCFELKFSWTAYGYKGIGDRSMANSFRAENVTLKYYWDYLHIRGRLSLNQTVDVNQISCDQMMTAGPWCDSVTLSYHPAMCGISFGNTHTVSKTLNIFPKKWQCFLVSPVSIKIQSATSKHWMTTNKQEYSSN